MLTSTVAAKSARLKSVKTDIKPDLSDRRSCVNIQIKYPKNTINIKNVIKIG